MTKGFYFTHGKNGYFLKSDKTRKTDAVLIRLIEGIGKHRNANPDTIERAKTDRATLEDFRRRTDAATLEERTTAGGFTYYNISGKGFSVSFPPEDFQKEIVII